MYFCAMCSYVCMYVQGSKNQWTPLQLQFQLHIMQLRLVVRVVRDLLLGNKPKDINLATECTAKNIVEIFVQEFFNSS